MLQGVRRLKYIKAKGWKKKRNLHSWRRLEKLDNWHLLDSNLNFEFVIISSSLSGKISPLVLSAPDKLCRTKRLPLRHNNAILNIVHHWKVIMSSILHLTRGFIAFIEILTSHLSALLKTFRRQATTVRKAGVLLQTCWQRPWVWVQLTARGGGGGGHLAKLFRNTCGLETQNHNECPSGGVRGEAVVWMSLTRRWA